MLSGTRHVLKVIERWYQWFAILAIVSVFSPEDAEVTMRVIIYFFIFNL